MLALEGAEMASAKLGMLLLCSMTNRKSVYATASCGRCQLQRSFWGHPLQSNYSLLLGINIDCILRQAQAPPTAAHAGGGAAADEGRRR